MTLVYVSLHEITGLPAQSSVLIHLAISSIQQGQLLLIWERGNVTSPPTTEENNCVEVSGISILLFSMIIAAAHRMLLSGRYQPKHFRYLILFDPQNASNKFALLLLIYWWENWRSETLCVIQVHIACGWQSQDGNPSYSDPKVCGLNHYTVTLVCSQHTHPWKKSTSLNLVIEPAPRPLWFASICLSRVTSPFAPTSLAQPHGIWTPGKLKCMYLQISYTPQTIDGHPFINAVSSNVKHSHPYKLHFQSYSFHMIQIKHIPSMNPAPFPHLKKKFAPYFNSHNTLFSLYIIHVPPYQQDADFLGSSRCGLLFSVLFSVYHTLPW